MYSEIFSKTKKRKKCNFKFYEFYEQNKNDFVVFPHILIIRTLAIGFIRTVFAQTLFRGRMCLGLPSSLLSEGSAPKGLPSHIIRSKASQA